MGAFAGLVATIAAGLAVYAGFGMPGMDHGDHPSARTPQQAAVVSPREFAHLIDEPDTVTVKSLPPSGTDDSIPDHMPIPSATPISVKDPASDSSEACSERHSR